MRIDLIANPDSAGRFEIIDLETGEEIENIAWADDEAGTYGVFRTRGRTMGDAPDADLRMPDGSGGYKVDEHEGDIDIVDMTVSPLKPMLLALLDDPEVVAKLRRVLDLESGRILYGGGSP